jgi:hypothetical protein
MAGKNSITGILAREALQKFPDLPSLTLAKLLYKESPKAFLTLEGARSAVRWARGAIFNKQHTYQTPNPIGKISPKKATSFRMCGYGIPEPAPSEFKVYPLPDDAKKYLVAGDIHIPYHDRHSLELMFAYAARVKVDGVLFLGDFMDCYQLSMFVKDPRQRHFKDEIQAAQDLLAFVRSKLKLKHLIWKLGNHEKRWDTYLQLKAPELFGIPGCSLPEIIHTERYDIEVVPENCPMRHSMLTILHGHEFGRSFSSPVNPARGMYLRGGGCIISAHEHRTSQHTEPTVLGTNISTWSMGCLCDLHPPYRTLNKWDHSFAIIHIHPTWRIEQKRIVNGEIL